MRFVRAELTEASGPLLRGRSEGRQSAGHAYAPI